MPNVRTRTNPFDLVKASDFTDEQIAQYWVDLTGEAKLYDLLQPRSAMPMLLLGGKGSGKTHLMRYYSAAVRKLVHGGSLRDAIAEDRFLGIYVRADGLNVLRFSGKGQPTEAWSSVFVYNFEIWLATHFLRHVAECIVDDSDADQAVARAAEEIFCSTLNLERHSVAGLVAALTSIRKTIDNVVSNAATGRAHLADIDIAFGPGDLLFGIADVVSSRIGLFDDVRLVFMIDEIENFSADQQRFLNSLIRYRRGQVTFKIGSRLYGIRTRKTLGGSEEEVRQGAEFEQVRLDEFLRSHESAYIGQARELVCRRLREAGFAIQQDGLASCFATPDSDDLYRSETLELMRRFDERGDERPHFKELRQLLGKSFPNTHEGLTSSIVEALRAPEWPLLEKLNIYLLCRDWRDSSTIVEAAQKIGELCQIYVSGGEPANYAEPLGHFKSDFFAQMCRDAGDRKVIYAGLQTLIDLSQGVPRNLLGLLKHIYRRSHFAGEQPFERGSCISIKSQGEGVRDAAAWFWEDAQPDQHGPEVRAAVQSLAELFGAVRFSIKPAECDLGTFTVKTGTGTEAARHVLVHAENWSYLIKVQAGGVDRNKASAVDEKYQISPMLAPRWGVSEYRRGTIQLSHDLFNSIFDPTQRGAFGSLLEARVAGMRDPFSSKVASALQGKLL